MKSVSTVLMSKTRVLEIEETQKMPAESVALSEPLVLEIEEVMETRRMPAESVTLYEPLVLEIEEVMGTRRMPAESVMLSEPPVLEIEKVMETARRMQAESMTLFEPLPEVYLISSLHLKSQRRNPVNLNVKFGVPLDAPVLVIPQAQ
jgi:hypothetical protein